MKKNFRLKTLCCLIALSGCGGGSSSSELTDYTIQTIQPIPLFNSNPIKLIDASSYYSHACSNPSFQFLIPTKINNDEYIDFIAHFWCDSLTPAEYLSLIHI